MTEMRILTVRQPWAWAISHGGKDVENRARNIAGDYRGPVAIHAARAWDYEWRDRRGARPLMESLLLADFPDLDFGVIIGVVDLVDVHHFDDCWDDNVDEGGVAHPTLCSPWAEPHTWHLELANAHALTEPIAYKGSLGLRRLPAETIDAVSESQRA